jgi:hypothetical protein
MGPEIHQIPEAGEHSNQAYKRESEGPRVSQVSSRIFAHDARRLQDLATISPTNDISITLAEISIHKCAA